MKLLNRLGWTPLFTTATVIVTVCFFGCGDGGKPSELVGHWEHYKGATSGKPESIELFKDGTGVVDEGSVTWKVENKRLVLLSTGVGLACDYRVLGYELVLVYDDKDSAIFVKKGKLEEYKKKKDDEWKKDYDQKKREDERIRKGAKQRIEKLSSYFTDSRDGQKYRTVTIGGVTWMAQNLNYQTGKSWCYSDYNSNCEKYGRLYDWNTARTACPAGWHLPSNQEWKDLANATGDMETASKKLKAANDWKSWNACDSADNADSSWAKYCWVDGNGTEEYGFSALPGGVCGRGCFGIAELGYWWTNTKSDERNAYARNISNVGYDVREIELLTSGGLSVRCVEGQDDVSSNLETTKNDEPATSSPVAKSEEPSPITMNDGGMVSKNAGSGNTGADGVENKGKKDAAGFGSGGGGVDDLLGGLMSGRGGGLELKKKGELNVSSPDFMKGGAMIGVRNSASIQRVVTQNMAALRYAYNKRLREKPGMTGEIKVKFAIDEFGRVISAQVVESTMNDSELEATVVSRVKNWYFEKIDKPGDVTEVTYPFVFSQ